MNIEKRFWGFVPMREDGKCWLWHGSRQSDGYGYFRVGSKVHKAHRISFEMINGTIPEGMLALHSCDNPSCVNPAHLRIGTYKENAEDRNAKERQARGERNGKAVLTVDDVGEIRLLLCSGMSSREIAEKYGVSHGAINSIKTGRTWRQI